MRYTYSDEEDDGSDVFSSRRSTRPGTGVSTPAEHAGPTVTASGRQVKSRLHGMYGESILVDQRKEIENERNVPASDEIEDGSEGIEADGRAQRTTRQGRPNRKPERYGDNADLEDESEAAPSGGDWSGDEDEPDEPELEPDFEEEYEDEDDDMSEAGSEMDDAGGEVDPPKSLVVQLRYKKKFSTNYGPNGTHSPQEINEKPIPVLPAAVMSESAPNFPSSGLPHHFSPPVLAQPFANGASPAELKRSSPEKLPEHLLYPQPQTVQL